MIKFLKKIFLVGIISLGIINFSNAGSYTYTGSYSVSRTIGTTVSNITYTLIPVPLNYLDPSTIAYSGFSSISCDISNFSTDFDFQNLSSRVQANYAYFPDVYTTSLTRTKSGFTSFTYNNLNPDFYTSSKGYPLYFLLGFQFDKFSSQVSGQVSFDWSCTISGDIIIDGGSSSCDYSDYELKSDITENYCTNKFSNLIDEEDITSGYCETEFGLIDPEDCPASGGSGDINWSNFFVNSEQIQGASMVYLRLPEFLNWDYTYINSGSTLNINVENAGDSEYIEDILEVQTFHPSSEDFTQSFTGTLVLLLPYIIIVLFIMFIWKLLRGIFK